MPCVTVEANDSELSAPEPNQLNMEQSWISHSVKKVLIEHILNISKTVERLVLVERPSEPFICKVLCELIADSFLSVWSRRVLPHA